MQNLNSKLWEPSKERIDRANLTRFIKMVREECDSQVGDDYNLLYEFSLRQAEKFWLCVWDFCGIRASGEREPVLRDGDKMPGATWFPKVRLNFAQNLLRHRDDKPAIIFRSEVDADGKAIQRELSFSQLHDEVSRLSQALRNAGVGVGDRVAGFLPNIPEAVIAMLATTAIGAVWSSCSPDFGINGVVDRFGQIKPKVLFSANSYRYGGKSHDCLQKLRGIVEAIDSLTHVVVVPYCAASSSLDEIRHAQSLESFVRDIQAKPINYSMQAWDHPLYIMYSSGTTGVPKCIVHGAGGTLIQHLKELVLHTDLKREDKILYYTTCGWMMWNWLVSSLAVGTTIVLHDGSPFYPNGSAMWDIVDEVGVSVFGTSAKYLAAIDKAGIKPMQSHKLLFLKTLLSTGSPLAPESYDYVYTDIKTRLLLSSISGGTDIISCFALGNPLLPVYRGELQCRGLGMKVEMLDEENKSVRETAGELSCSAPFPSMPIGFYGDPDGSKYKAAYFEKIPNVWCHGDFAMLTEHDGVVILGRSDAVLNPGGVRIGTAEIYRQVETIDEVLESIAVGQDWDNDVRVVLFVRLRDGVLLDENLQVRIRKVIRDHTTPRHVPAKIIAVTDIPRTISGKITELAVRNVIHRRAVKNTDALANPDALRLYEDLPELQN